MISSFQSLPTLIQAIGNISGAEKSGAVAFTFILNIGASAGTLILSLGQFKRFIWTLSGIIAISLIISLKIEVSNHHAKQNKCVMVIDGKSPIGLIANTAAILGTSLGQRH